MTFRVLTPVLVELSAAVEFYESRVSELGADFS
jgi:hypothetical protein